VLVVTESAVKQHLMRLYRKFHIPGEGRDRRARLANHVIQTGLIEPAGAEIHAPWAPARRQGCQ
jgi:hypothetical protein